MFCGRGKLSNEHVIPSWVEKTLPPLEPGVRFRHTHKSPTGYRTFEADAFQLTVKRVCKPCNEGWMEQEIEAPNQSILPPMFNGQASSLTPEEQELVATWALKTHMMAQYRHEPFRPVAEEQLRWLYETKSPLPKSRVWLASFAGELLHRAWGRTHNFELANVSAGSVLNAEMMTLCIGHLVFQTFKWTGLEEFNLTLPDETAQFVLPIRPSSSLTLPWPPALTLDTEQSLSNFANAFVNTGPPPE